jgi:hypothetical protein
MSAAPSAASQATPGRSRLESASVSMQRSTRLRRMVVAFLVVLVLAVAARFARASSHDAMTVPGRTSSATASFAIEIESFVHGNR